MTSNATCSAEWQTSIRAPIGNWSNWLFCGREFGHGQTLVQADNFRWYPIRNERTFVDQNSAIAVIRNLNHVVRNKEDCLPCSTKLLDAREALLLKGRIAHCENFVHQKDIGIDLGGYSKS